MIKKTLIAAAGAALLGNAALADLTGTTLDLELNQSGFLGNMVGPTGGTHTYGTTESFTGDGASGRTWDATSPAPHPGYDNSILIDFTNFDLAAYFAMGPSTATFDITNIAEDVAVGSVDVFLSGDLNNSIALSADGSGSSLVATWDVETVFNGNPVNPGVVLTWNSIPTPGTAVLLGLAGLTAGQRRRKRS